MIEPLWWLTVTFYWYGKRTCCFDCIIYRTLGVLAKADRIFKKLLFGWLPQTQSAHGAKLRWKDKVRQDLGIPGSDWYCLREDKIAWRDVCQDSTSIRQLSHMGRKAIAMVWSTTSGGKHHPLDGCTSMVQWCVCAWVGVWRKTNRTECMISSDG